MEKIFGKNYKTLLSGWIMGFLAVLLPILVLNRWPTPIEITLAAGLALQGTFAKDSSTTGIGTSAKTLDDVKATNEYNHLNKND